jgi:2-keto-4-pentenoate hydratase
MNNEEIATLSKELLTAEDTRTPVAPLTERFPGITIADAYNIQLGNINTKLGRGDVIVGKKIGLTSQAMQEMFNVKEADYGHLLNSGVILEGQPVSTGKLIQPRLEAEICFLLKHDLIGPGVTTANVLAAAEGVMPAFEIIDSRYKDWKIKIQDTIADNASNAAAVIGGKLTKAKDLDLRLIGMVYEKNGEGAATAAGAAVLGNPAQAVAWLANTLAQYGITLKAGEFIMAGALTAALPIKAGDNFTASFDRLGSVSVRFI